MAGEVLPTCVGWALGDWFHQTCVYHGHSEQIFHAGVLSLVFVVGYLGLDKVGERPTGDALRDRIQSSFSQTADSVCERILSKKNFSYDVGVTNSVAPGVYFSQLCKNSHNLDDKPSRWNLHWPYPFHTFWFLCRVLEEKFDWLPYLFAMICFVKFFCISVAIFFGDVPELILFASLVVDILACFFVIQRVWRHHRAVPALVPIKKCAEKWLSYEANDAVNDIKAAE